MNAPYTNEFYIPFENPQYRADFVHLPEVSDGARDARRAWLDMRNISLATADADGDPHNTVLASGLPKPGDEDADYAAGFLAREGCPFWSFPDSLHVANLRQRNVGAMAVFSSDKNAGALYIKVEVEEVPFGEIDAGLRLLNEVRYQRGVGHLKQREEFDPDKTDSPAVLFLARVREMYISIRGYKHTQPGVGPPWYRHTSNVRWPISVDQLWSPQSSGPHE